MRTPGAPSVVEGLRAHPWFAGPEDERASPRVGNVLVGAAVPVLSLVASLARDAPAPRIVPTVVIALVVGVALTWLGRWPVHVLGIALAGTVAGLAVDQVHPVLVAASVIAVFAVASMRPRRVALAATAISACRGRSRSAAAEVNHEAASLINGPPNIDRPVSAALPVAA